MRAANPIGLHQMYVCLKTRFIILLAATAGFALITGLSGDSGVSAAMETRLTSPTLGDMSIDIVAPPADKAARAPKRRVIAMVVTAYCPCRSCCGPDSKGKTASGASVRANGGRFVAADTVMLPMNSRVSIPGYHSGAAVPVLDRGGDIRGNRLDVFFPSHGQAKAWGVRRLKVTVLYS